MANFRPLSIHAPSPPWPFQRYERSPEPSPTDFCRTIVTSEFSANSDDDYSQYSGGSSVAEESTRSAIGEEPWVSSDSDKTHSSSGTPKDTSGPSVLRTERKFKVYKAFLLTVAGIALFAIGLFGSYIYNTVRREHLPEIDTAPPVYIASGGAWNLTKGTTSRLIPPARGAFSNGLYDRGNFAKGPELGGSPAGAPGEDMYRRETTERGPTRRRNKIAVWEGKRMYEHGKGDRRPGVAKASTVTAVGESEPARRAGSHRLMLTKQVQKGAGTTPVMNTKAPWRTLRVETPRRQTSQATISLKDTKFCETKICERESVYLTNYLNWNLKPCDNFYGFVCDRWKNLHPEVGTSADALLIQRVEEDIYHVLASRERLTPQMLKTAALVRSCARQRPSEDHRSTLLDLMGSFGLRGWPFIRDTKTLMDVWRSASLLLRDLGLASLVSVSVGTDTDRDSRHIISLGEPSLMIGQYGTRDSRLPEWYSNAITSCFKIFTSGRYADVAKRVLGFSARLAEISVNRGYESFAVSRYRVVQLKHYNHLMHLLTLVFNNVTVIHSRMRVLVKSEAYLRSLPSVMHVTKGMDVLNYLGFRALLHVSPLLPDQAIDLAAVQMREITGISQCTGPRWRRCLRMFERVLPLVFLHSYAMTKLQVPNKDKLWVLLNEIQATLVVSLNSAPWISVDDKVVLKSKLAKIKLEVFHKFRAKIAHRHQVAEFPSVMEHRSLVMMYTSLARQFMEKKLSKIKFPRSTQAVEWKGSVFDVEPLFDWESNTVFIPMAMTDPSYMMDSESLLLQVPRIATKVTEALLQGIHQGNFPRSKLKWSVDTELGFREIRKCLERHYDVPPDEKIHSEVTWEFNVLDTMALSPAFKLFLRNVNQVNIEDYGLLTGHNITVKQLFFVLYAKSFCETMDAERKKQVIQESVYSASCKRVNGPLRNSFRFPSYWACAGDSLMNADPKCTIWTS